MGNIWYPRKSVDVAGISVDSGGVRMRVVRGISYSFFDIMYASQMAYFALL